MYVVRQKSERDIETSSDKGNYSSLHNIKVDNITKAELRLKFHKANGVEDASSD